VNLRASIKEKFDQSASSNVVEVGVAPTRPRFARALASSNKQLVAYPGFSGRTRGFAVSCDAQILVRTCTARALAGFSHAVARERLFDSVALSSPTMHGACLEAAK
jgi:hypothetical protein